MNRALALTEQVDAAPLRICSDCGEPRHLALFRPGRAQCNLCYNSGRRAYHARAHEAKQVKRRIYEAKPDVIARKQLARERPESKAKAKIASQLWRSKPEVQSHLVAYKESYSAQPVVRGRAAFVAARQRAKASGLPFSLSESWIEDRIVAGRCELSGIEFTYGRSPKGCRNNPFAPSVDQIVPGLGYTEANSRLVLAALNNALGEWGEDILEKVALGFLGKRGFKIVRTKEPT